MTTFWVTAKKNCEETEQTMLNPLQRLRQTHKPHEVSQGLCQSHPPSPPNSHSFLTQPVHPRLRRAPSPKPDEWPEADRRLSRTEYGHPRQRSCTVPTVDILAADVGMVMGTRHGSIGTPFAASRQDYLTPRHEVDQFPQSPFNLSRAGSVVEQLLPRSRNDSIASEFNLLRVRDSMSFPLPTIKEASPSELAVFAALADQNARQARKLADWAAELARAVAKSREGSTELELPPEGTPVDPPQPPQLKSDTTTAKKPEGSDASTQSSCRIM